MKLEFSRQIFEKYSNITFHENPSSGSRVAPCGQTDGRTDMTQLMDDFRNFANSPKKWGIFLTKKQLASREVSTLMNVTVQGSSVKPVASVIGVCWVYQ
jgi:hypothetical protein